MSGRVLLRLAACVLCVGAAGCRHKVQAVPAIPAPTPVVVANAPVPAVQLPSETAGQAPVPTAPVPAPPVKKAKKKVVPAPAPAPVEAASVAPPPPPVEIGSLTAEGDQSGGSRKKAADLLNENTKRLAELSTAVRDKQKDQIVKVQSFQADGIKALNGGDTDAAMTLATKAKLLLDEITK